MSHTFKYPDTTAPTTTLTFDTALFAGDEPYFSRNQEVGTTLGGSPQARSQGENLKYHPLTVRVPRLSAAGEGHVTDWPDVVAFISSTVDFHLRDFWWTDNAGVKRRVRIMNDSTEPKASYASKIDYQFILRVLEEVAS